MVCEIMADTLLYGTISLLTACTTTAIVLGYLPFTVNKPYEHRRGNSMQLGLKTSARPCPCLKERDGSW